MADNRFAPKLFDENEANNNIIVRYLIQPRDKASISDVVDDFIKEFKGNWTNLPYSLLNKADKYENTIYELTINELSNYAYMSVAYPADNFELEFGGITQILSIIAGDNISSKTIASIRVTDLHLPKVLTDKMKGPLFGVDGIREIYGIPIDPLLHMILKPRLGLGPEDYADIAYRAAISGIDAIRDDQMLISTSYCPFYERVEKISSALKKAEDKTGKKAFYYPNITISPIHIAPVIDYLRNMGIRTITVNAVYEGLGIIEYLRAIAPDFIIQAHRSGYIILSNNRNYSISYAVIAQLLHYSGADEIHIGSIFGRFDVKKQETLKSLEHICNPLDNNTKKSFPIVAGSVTPAIIEATIDEVSSNVIFMAGSGIIGHPIGIESGVKALKEMIHIAMEGSNINTLMTGNLISSDFLHALHLWGYRKDGINNDLKVVEKARQLLQVNDSLDEGIKEIKKAEFDYFKELLQDPEIGIITDALSNSATVLTGSVGLIAEKYIRKICNTNNVPFCQMFNGIKHLRECSLIDERLTSKLHEIRSYYNKAKHKNIYISYRDALTVIENMIYFFKWIENNTDLTGAEMD